MMWKRRLSLLLFVALVLSALGNVSFPRKARAATTSGLILQQVYTDKARYNPGNTVTITVSEKNNTGSSWTGSIALSITHLESSVYTSSQNVTLANGATGTTTFTWTAPATDFQGYRLDVTAGTIDYLAGAIDVSSDWTRFPRYGEMDTFDSSETQAQSQDLINQLARDYHINAYQIYDWFWRHENLIPKTNGVPNSSWTDWSGRNITWSTVQNQINAIHAQNGAAMAYNMTYGALNGYGTYSPGVSTNWAVFPDSSHTTQSHFDFGPAFPGTSMYIFNPTNVGWQNYMVGQYQDALTTGNFDGLQLDQLGKPWCCTFGDSNGLVYDNQGKPVDIGYAWASLVGNDKATNSAHKVTFNVVNGGVTGSGVQNGAGIWGVDNVIRNAKTDFTYSELWDNTETFTAAKAWIDYARRMSGNKAMVVAAYMNYANGANQWDANWDPGPRSEAESATLTGVTTNTDHAGYTGTGFVDGFASVGDAVTFTINITETGKYSLVFRYGNGSGALNTRNVYVDGANVATLKFSPIKDDSGNNTWDRWAFDADTVVNFTSTGNHTVKLAYDSGNTGAINLDNIVLGTFDDNSVRLADAAFAAAGASHIELGEGDQMLAHPYFVNHSKQMRNSLKSAMKDHWDFITAYEDLLFDTDVISTDSGTQFVNISNVATNGDGSGNAVWTVLKHSTDYDIVHLINLLGHDNQWRHTASTPTTQNNLAVKYYLGPNVSASGVYVASPDVNHGLTQSLSYTTGSDSTGNYVSFTVPSLQYWDMIYVRRSFTAPTGNVYEAESAIRSSVTTNTNHSGYTGSGFVDGFGSSGKGVSFIVNAPGEDAYTLSFKYANATGSTATRSVFVDGNAVGSVSMRNLYNWDMWNTADISVHLTAGLHTVVLWFGGSDSTAINLDSMTTTRQSQPTRTSVTSLYMNNWDDLVGIWMASKLNQNDTGTYGPRLGELRYSSDWTTNQIVDYSGFFRDETGTTVKYNQVHNFDAEAWLNSDGTLTSNYLNYSGSALPVKITRSYAMVPNQPFMVVKYDITNLTGSAVTYDLLDAVHVNNTRRTQNPPTNVSGSWDATRNAMFVDMTAAGQYVVTLGALQTMDHHQVGDDTVSTGATASPWHQFDGSGTLGDNGSVTVPDVSLGFQKRYTISAGSTATAYFYITVRSTMAAAQSAADTARGQTGSYWFTQTGTSYTNWLNAGTRVSFSDSGINTAFDRALITIKQTQNPTLGTIPAATNPGSYGYKVWARDSAVTFTAMDAAGHTSEADKYYRWLASRQNTDGSFHTTFDNWTGNYVSFVEPEHDSIGMFVNGVYRHWKKTGDNQFLSDMWSAVSKSGDFIMNNINSTVNLGPSDASIWEETQEFNTFSQSTYLQALATGQYMARQQGDTTRADNWNGAAGTITTSVQRSFESSPVGEYNDSNRYYNRAVSTSYAPTTTVDSSSVHLGTMGNVDWASLKTQDHLTRILGVLTHDIWGVARYTGDAFYYTSPYSPAGNEALAAEPSWPQMSMWAAIQEMYEGKTANALQRLQWYVQRTARGYMHPGEAISNVTQQPLVSTSSEPITAAAFVLAALQYQGLNDVRTLPPQYNAGANKAMTINSPPTASDWSQWVGMPYFQDKTSDAVSTSTMTDIKKVYVTNDSNNIYIRVDNASGSLSAYNTEPKFGIFVYSEDFNHGAGVSSKSTGFYGGTLDRSMQYMVSRWSDSSTYNRYKVVSGAWTWDSNVNATAPQWETSSGRIEIVIPISVLTSTGSAGMGSWANLNILLAYHNQGNNTWTDDDLIAIHYRLTDSSTAWIWGNVDK